MRWLSPSGVKANFISNKGGNKRPTNKTSKQPANTLRCGSIKATIWKNTSEKGSFYATTFYRPFKDHAGEWRNGTLFGLHDLEALLTVAR
ncbi:MAG TPA: hypothetical protein VFT59_02485, partial [Candidatus Saccharimonadales bacterium]|nr:hypothetical protein [Candidatus Saccharimonadales bacterium]